MFSLHTRKLLFRAHKRRRILRIHASPKAQQLDLRCEMRGAMYARMHGELLTARVIVANLNVQKGLILNLHARVALAALEKFNQFCAAVHVELLIDMPNMGTNRSDESTSFSSIDFAPWPVAHSVKTSVSRAVRPNFSQPRQFVHPWLAQVFPHWARSFHVKLALFNRLKYERIVAVGKHESLR